MSGLRIPLQDPDGSFQTLGGKTLQRSVSISGALRRPKLKRVFSAAASSVVSRYGLLAIDGNCLVCVGAEKIILIFYFLKSARC